MLCDQAGLERITFLCAHTWGEFCVVQSRNMATALFPITYSHLPTAPEGYFWTTTIRTTPKAISCWERIITLNLPECDRPVQAANTLGSKLLTHRPSVTLGRGCDFPKLMAASKPFGSTQCIGVVLFHITYWIPSSIKLCLGTLL